MGGYYKTKMKWVTRDRKTNKRRKNKSYDKPFREKSTDSLHKKRNTEYKKQRRVQEELEWENL
jgi:hypothetical protein